MSKSLVIVNDYWHYLNYRKETVDLILGEQNYLVACPKNSTFNVDDVKLNVVNIHLIRGSFNVVRPIYELYKLIVTLKPDTIMSFGIQVGLITSVSCLFSSRIHLFTITGLGSFFSRRIPRLLLSNFIIPLIKCCSQTQIIVQNNTDFKLLKRKLKRGLHRVNGSGLPEFLVKPVMSDRNEIITITYIGRLLRSKGVEDLIRFAEKYDHPGVKFILAGGLDKQNTDSIDLGSLDINDNVELLGHIDDVVQLIDSSDVIILPSYREGLSRSLIEALSRGKPIITTYSPGCNELVTNGYNGFKFKAGDLKDMEAAISQFVNLNSKEYTKFCYNSRELFLKHYTSEKVAAQYRDILLYH